MRVTKEGVAFFELDLDLKDPESNVYLYKARPGGSRQGRALGGVLRSWGRGRGVTEHTGVSPKSPRHSCLESGRTLV